MLEIKNLAAGYGGETVIRGLSLCFEPGRIYGVVGKNGCGKTTLLKACAGLIEPSEGNICLDGKELSAYAPSERACRISYLSQLHGAPGITVERMVMHGRYPRLGYPKKPGPKDREMVESALEKMQLCQLRHKRLSELSGGECQRAYLAMQLAQDSDHLLLDEPTSYMDIEYQLLLMNILGELRDAGKTVIMVLHDLAQALKYSDCIVAMDNGRIAHCGTPETALESKILDEIFHIRIIPCGENYVFEK